MFGRCTQIPFTMGPYGKLQTPVTPDPLNRSRSNFHTMFRPWGPANTRSLKRITLKGIGDFQKPRNNFLKIRVPWRPEPTCLGPPCQNVLRVSMFSTSLPNLVALTRRAAEKNGVPQKCFDPKYFRSPRKISYNVEFQIWYSCSADGIIRTKFIFGVSEKVTHANSSPKQSPVCVFACAVGSGVSVNAR
jgi:hypothetical protein